MNFKNIPNRKYLPGVTYSERGNVYIAKVHRNGKTISISRHTNELDAHQAYLDYCKLHPPAKSGPTHSAPKPPKRTQRNESLKGTWLYGL